MGCSTTGTPSAPTPTREPGVYLSASHHPVYLAALELTGGIDGVHVDRFLQPQGGYLEDFRLSELDWARAQQADIVLMLGGGLEDFIPVFAAEDGKPLIVAAEHVERLPGRVIDPDEDEAPADNPYIWLSPTRWAKVVDGMAAGLAQLDPERQPAYIAANDAAQARIASVGLRLQEAMLPYAGRPVIVMHPALSYLAEEAGLQVVLTVERDPSVLPMRGDIEDLQMLLAPYPDAVLLLEDGAPLALRNLGGRPTALCEVLCQGIPGDASAWDTAMERNIAALEQVFR